MKILIAPNAFKGTLGPFRAARAIARGIGALLPAAELRLFPVSDGGDGLLEAVMFHEGGRRIASRVPGPLFRPVRARWLLGGGRAVLEMAEAAGIKYLDKKRLDPLNATSFGVGVLLREAARRGARDITVGLGGTASSDGGAGCAAGFGFKLLDARGRPVPPGAAGLLRLRRIIPPPDIRAFGKIKVAALADVDNPLCGRRGSASVYGPQKGASPSEVALIGAALLHFAAVVKRDLGADIRSLKGGAAAGGLGAGLTAFFGARLRPGAAAVLERLGFEEAVQWADLVVTGEGRFDGTSFCGKAPVEAAKLARKWKKPSVLVCGSCALDAPRLLEKSGILGIITLDRTLSRETLFGRPAAALERGVRLGMAGILGPL